MHTGATRRYRELAFTLARREITVRYKRSALGLAWALVEPLSNVAVYLVVFGVFLDASSGTPNYALCTLLGLLPWLFFSTTVEQSAGVLLEHAPLIRKIAFPRELLVVAVVVSRLTTLLAGLAMASVFVGFEVARGADLPWGRLALVPVGVVLITCSTVGISLLVAALQVLLRDTQFLVRFVLRLGFYACPVVYAVERVPAEWKALYGLNPLVGAIWCFQGIVSGAGGGPGFVALVASAVGSPLLLALGWFGFRRLMPAVADRV